MMENELLIIALTAVLVKTVDEIEDTPRGCKGRCPRCMLRFPFALAYGALIGHVINYSTVSTMWIAALLAQFVTGKIDRMSHLLGFLTAAAFMAALGVHEFSAQAFAIFLLFAALDEIRIFDFGGGNLRLGLKFAALMFGIYGRWDYFAAIMVFDIAYYLAGRLFPKEWCMRVPGEKPAPSAG